MTQEQRCHWEISTSLLSERNSVAISQKDQRTTFRQGHFEKGLIAEFATLSNNKTSSHEILIRNH